MDASRQATAETGADRRYRDRVTSDWADLGIWDYLRYDETGHLWLNELRVLDAVRKYGTPLEIVDTTLIERRSREWFALTRDLAAQLSYPGTLNYLYASKANMASEITHAAYRAGWQAETSAQQDLEHLQWMRRHGILPEGLRVVCNGFKLPADRYGFPEPRPIELVSGVELPIKDISHIKRVAPYADTIRAMAREGWDITPILDADELETFAAEGSPEMNVGLRLKFGQVEDRVALDAHVSRFGLDQERLRAEARAIEALPHLRLTTLHCMVGAAQTIPVDRFVASLRLAGRIFAQLRLEHPSLHELNIGGGVPPLGEAYNHRALLTGLMQALAEEAAEAGAPAPDLTFEFGSLVAAEAGFHVFRVMQRKANHHAGTDSEPAMPWAILDGGLMAAIPDMLLIDKPFRFLSIWGANAPAIQARLGDLSCDSDGRYPPESFGERASVWLPEMEGPSWLLIQGVGAYQEILSGVRGAHHCGLLEAIELVLERHADGQIRGRIMPRQTPTEAAAVLGYTDEAAAALKRTLPPSSSDR